MSWKLKGYWFINEVLTINHYQENKYKLSINSNTHFYFSLVKWQPNNSLHSNKTVKGYYTNINKRERDQLERETKVPHSPRCCRRCKGEAKDRQREGEMKGCELKRRQQRAKSSPTKLNRHDRWPEASPMIGNLKRCQRSWIVTNRVELTPTELNRHNQRPEALPIAS